MAAKTEMWAAFQYFDVSPIDHTFKRDPGQYFRSCNAEETPLPARPGRGRVHSNPPAQSEAWTFHHRSASPSEYRRGPMLRCRSAEDCSYDKFTATLARDLYKCTGFEGSPLSRRGQGKFSPEANGLTHKLATVDLLSRGICDVDRNLKRGVGFERRACATTLGNMQVFAEEHHAELKSSISKLTSRNVAQAVPEFVHDLEGLGIECRRLQGLNYSQISLKEEETTSADEAGTLDINAQRYLESLGLDLEGLGMDCKRLLASSFSKVGVSSEKKDRLLMGQGVPRRSNKSSPVIGHDNSSKTKQRATLREEKPQWLDAAANLNVNTRRLMSGKAVPQEKLSKHVQSKSLKKLLAKAKETKSDAESQAETCSTCDSPSRKPAPADEIMCQLPLFEIAKLDLRKLRAPSESSTCAPSSPGCLSSPASHRELIGLSSPASTSSESRELLAPQL